MLCADGQADGIRLNALFQQFFRGELGMGGTGRVDYEALYIGYIGKQGEDFQIVHKPPGFLLATLNLKGEDTGSSIWEILCVQCVIRMSRQAEMIDFFHLWMMV